ncbi:MAG: lactate utilization protein [Candidatus Bathyarchaeota archaeon]|nr:lactate utilization protein [Candidatus Bathyarchaeota archaeon]
MDGRISRTMENLKKHNINCFFVKDEREAREKVLELVEPGASVGMGGSMSVHSISVVPELEKRNTMFNPYDREGKVDKSKNQTAIRRMGLVADYFLTGTNSITEDGYIVNTDGMGNRVGAISFGPKKLILVAGVNKLVPDVHGALERIRTIAAPLNGKRHSWDDIPCATTNDPDCILCISPHRQCNSTLITHNSRDPERINIVLVDKDLGY